MRIIGCLTTVLLAGHLEIVVDTLMGLVMLAPPFVAIAGAGGDAVDNGPARSVCFRPIADTRCEAIALK